MSTPRDMAGGYGVVDGVAIVELAQGAINALSLALRLRVDDSLRAALADPAVRAVVLTGAGKGFSGGGDITEFDRPDIDLEPSPNTLHASIEAASKPVVAALHGIALGGGLELALACHARVAHADTRVGLPEVQLGLVPGAGGTQRLPRLVGLERALNMIVSGSTHTADSLRDSGLFDRVTDGSALDEALLVARELTASMAAGTPLRRTGALTCHMDNAQAFTALARAALRVPANASRAPARCIDCVESAALLPFDQGLVREAAAFKELRHSPQFAALRHVFLATRSATHLPGVAPAAVRPIKSAAVIGGGTMGTGIAIALANAGLSVLLVERDRALLDRALKVIVDHYEGQAGRKRMSTQTAVGRIALVAGSVEMEGIVSADIVIEAVFEDMEVKRQVFERIDAFARPGAILATNTSMLDVDRIAGFTRRPADVVGLHFFSPAHVMQLLEVVRGRATAPEVLASVMVLARQIGKTAVISGVCEGFIGNRMFESYMMQAGLLLDEGALPHQVDEAMERWGMAMGPFRVNDLAGNDLAAKIRATRIANDPSRVYSAVFDALVASGRHGQKAARGWYDYPPGQRKPAVSDEVIAMVESHSRALGLQRRTVSDAEIVDRLLLALANEGYRIVDEGIAQRASDIDVVYTAGYGFPRWRGGPMFQARQRGPADVLATMKRFTVGPAYQHADAFWQPAPLLVELAAENSPASSNLAEAA